MLTRTLINNSLLKEYSPFPLNFSTKEVDNYVKLAEIQWIEPLIGSDYYEELLDEVEADELTPENSTALVEAIWPYLGFAVALEALPLCWAHISEIGVTLGKSDNSESLTLKDLTLIQQHLRAQVEVRKEYCKKWLCERQESFPLLNVCDCGCNSCGGNSKLLKPNPLNMLYSTYRKCSNIR